MVYMLYKLVVAPGEMTQWIRTRAALPDELCLIPMFNGGLRPPETPVPGDLDNLFWPPWVLHACSIHAGKTPMHIRSKLKKQSGD